MKTVIIGAGGHAGVLMSVLRAQSAPKAVVVGIIDAHPALKGQSMLDLPVLGGDDILEDLKKSGISGFINGLGRIGKANNRRSVHERGLAAELSAVSVISPHAVVAKDATIGDGAQILPGAIVNNGAQIGEGAVVNTGAIIEHDCLIGDHAFVGPGATVLGEVTVGAGAFVGAGSVVLQGLEIGDGALVGAGATVIRDVAANISVVGVPARRLPDQED